MVTLSKDNQRLLKYYKTHPDVYRMKQFYQHGAVTTYEHSLNVTYTACNIACKLNFSEEELNNIITGAMLHDFYLYDWHDGRKRPEGMHAWSHPKIALRNANRIFDLNTKQKNIIRSHMYPTCLFHPPKYKEAWIVTLSDKVCAIKEYMGYTFQKKKRRRFT